jgi:hypothetical protein
MSDSFTRAVMALADPPCVRFGGCVHIQQCRDEELACEQFMHYVNKGGSRGRRLNKVPASRYYERIFICDGEE